MQSAKSLQPITYICSSDPAEIIQYLKSYTAALFRMELGTIDIFVFNRGRKLSAVLDPCRGIGIAAKGRIGMHKVHIISLIDAVIKSAAFICEMQRVPAYLQDLSCIYT